MIKEVARTVIRMQVALLSSGTLSRWLLRHLQADEVFSLNYVPQSIPTYLLTWGFGVKDNPKGNEESGSPVHKVCHFLENEQQLYSGTIVYSVTKESYLVFQSENVDENVVFASVKVEGFFQPTLGETSADAEHAITYAILIPAIKQTGISL